MKTYILKAHTVTVDGLSVVYKREADAMWNAKGAATMFGNVTVEDTYIECPMMNETVYIPDFVR